MNNQAVVILIGCAFFIFTGCIVYFGNNYNLNNIKAKTVGDGQHGTARFAVQSEINEAFERIQFKPERWREGIDRPDKQGILVGSYVYMRKTTGYIDVEDVHLLMIGAAGVGKTAFFLYPNLEYACASDNVNIIFTKSVNLIFTNLVNLIILLKYL